MKSWLKKASILWMIGMTFLLGACNNESENNVKTGNEPHSDRIQIVTTISQIGEPIEVIGGDRVDVESLMGPGVDPHLYKATQGDINTLQDADIILYNGLHLEGNMGEVFANMSANKTIVSLGESLDKEKFLMDEEGAIDPHIWFDVDLWKEALDVAVEELKQFSPEDADYFEENKQMYFSKLDELKEEAVKKISIIPEEQRVLVTAHDAFGYFGRMNDIEVIGLQGLSTEDEVGLSDIGSTVQLLIEKKVPAVFIESSINQSSIRAVIDGASKEGLEVTLGGELFSDAMGAKGTEEGTYLGMYHHNVNTIYQALTGGSKQ
jgi:manganese/zinc/iron transport system substrate-binding protein